MPSLDELNSRFSHDCFATAVVGARILEAEPGRAVCVLPLRPAHMNANGTPMGGAIFTLADFAFAVAANGFSDRVTVSQHASVTFLAPAKGTELRAEATCLKAGRTLCLYTVDITDNEGVHVAYVTVNGFTMG